MLNSSMQLEQILKPLNETNFISYCSFHYKNNACLCEEEFFQDIELSKQIRKLIIRKSKDKFINDRILVNNIIILTNVFGVLPAIRIIFYHLESQYHDIIFPYLHDLKLLNKYIKDILFIYDGVSL